MAYTKYSLTPANNTAAPPDGAPEGMLPSAVNDTMRDMMAQIRDCGDGIRDGTYTMTAPKITGGTITGSTINNSAIGGTTAAAGAFTTLSATGVTTVQAGTVSLPAITTTGDTNTGIYFPAADTIAFTEGGVESMRIDSSGNVGIGTSSPAVPLAVYKASDSAINIQNSTSGVTNVDGLQLLLSGANGYMWNYENGASIFGTNNAERMRIDSSGNVGIGTTSPLGKLEVRGSGNTALYLHTGNNSGDNSLIYFGDTGSATVGLLAYDHGTNAMTFHTNSAERMRIDSSGNLLVGTTTATYSCHQINKGSSSGATAFVVGAGSTGIGLFVNNCDQNNYSASAVAFGGGRNSSTGRSINVGGTVNASGTDYAEYMVKNNDFTVTKGDLVGIDVNGKLTNIFSNAISFVVKSTNPSYVGGDVWGSVDVIGQRPSEEASQEEKDAFEEKLENARQAVDRIAFAGQVPVNVIGAIAGQYIVPVNDNGSIKGQAVSNPTFEQYQLSVGKVIAIEADGRARIIVKVA